MPTNVRRRNIWGRNVRRKPPLGVIPRFGESLFFVAELGDVTAFHAPAVGAGGW